MIPSPQKRPAFWATPAFRHLVIAGVLGFAVVAVATFELKPLFEKSEKKEMERAQVQNTSGRPAYVPAAPGTETEVRFDGKMADVKDLTPMDQRGEPYGQLLRYLGKVDPKVPSETSVFVDYPLFAQHAADLRGRPVRITALFVDSDALRIDRDKLGTDWIHRTYLVGTSGDEPYLVDLREPPPKGIRHRSLVQADALFFKMTTWKDSKDRDVVAPMFVATDLKLIRENPGTASTELGTLTVGVAMLSVVAVIFFSLRLWSKPKPPAILRHPVPKSGS